MTRENVQPCDWSIESRVGMRGVLELKDALSYRMWQKVDLTKHEDSSTNQVY